MWQLIWREILAADMKREIQNNERLKFVSDGTLSLGEPNLFNKLWAIEWDLSEWSFYIKLTINLIRVGG